jgi:hypothetical protein
MPLFQTPCNADERDFGPNCKPTISNKQLKDHRTNSRQFMLIDQGGRKHDK